MPGSPIRRARREAAAKARNLIERGEEVPLDVLATLAGDITAAEPAQQKQQQFVRAPLSSTESRARSVRDLYEQMLSGAESALVHLHAGMAAGLDARELKELSVTANVLMRAAKLIEDDKPVEEPPSLAELEAAEREAERLLEERKARG